MVPNDWEILPFSDIATIGNGQVDPKEEPYLSMKHIGPENVISHSGQLVDLHTSKELALISGKYFFDDNAIVYSKIRPNLNKVCTPHFVGICSADMYPIWPKPFVDKNFLFQYMLGPIFNKIAISFSMRTGMPKINRADLNGIEIAIPPIKEQHKIAKILSTWDKSIIITENLIANSEMQKKSLMQQLLTGKKRLLDENGVRFSGEWKRTQLKTFLTESTLRNKSSNIERVLSITNHSGFVLPEEQFSKRVASNNVENYKIVTNGQFGYNPSRLNVGSFGRLDQYENGVLSPMYVIFNVDTSKVHSDYFLFWMGSGEANQRIKNSTQGSVRESVGFDALCAIPFNLPSISEQEKIAEVISNADREIELLQAKLEHLKQEKKALMQQLLTGKRRVVIN